MVDQAELTGRHFLRVSRDHSGRERSNDEQQEDGERRWPFTFVGRPYREVASASKYAKRARDEFPQLISDLGDASFGADVLVMWEGSRGARKVSEWVTLIEACEDAAKLIAITEHDRIYDPANARDRKDLIDIANDAEYEAAKISARVTRSSRTTVKAGRGVGVVPYGWRRIYDPLTRKFIRQEEHPGEAPVIDQLFRLLEAGHSLRAIAKDFAGQGVTNRSAKPFTPPQLRNIATNIAYIGKRAHSPVKDWRTKTGEERRRTAHVVDAAWPSLVDERRWLAVQRILNDPARKTVHNRPGRARHPFSMIVRCDPCGGPLAVAFAKNPDGAYYCRDKGCVKVSKPEVDAIATDAIVGFLSRPDQVEALVAPDNDDGALAAVRLELAKIQKELDELEDQVGSGKLTARFAARSEPQILERQRAAEQRERELMTPSALRALIEPGADVAERWENAPVSTKRMVARMLLCPQVLGELRVKRREGRGPVRTPAKERILWRYDNAS